MILSYLLRLRARCERDKRGVGGPIPRNMRATGSTGGVSPSFTLVVVQTPHLGAVEPVPTRSTTQPWGVTRVGAWFATLERPRGVCLTLTAATTCKLPLNSSPTNHTLTNKPMRVTKLFFILKNRFELAGESSPDNRFLLYRFS